jgi:hypothetical protein
MARSSRTVPPSPVATRSREVREQARKELQGSFNLSEAAHHDPSKSAQLCRQSDELLRRSRNLRHKLRKICDAT